MKKVLLLFLTAIVSCIVGHAATIDLSFSAMGQTNWGSSYSAHTYETNDFKIVFDSYNKQTSTITDVPVSKGSPLTISLKNNNTFKSIKFTLKQWNNKAQTATLQYSLDGTNFNAFKPAVSSSTFVVEATDIPTGTVAIKMTFSSTSNQVGVVSIDYEINGAGTGADAEISFAEASQRVAVGDNTYKGQTLVNPHGLTEVEYTSSATDIATVDSKTGEVTLTGKTGSTTIIATSAATAEYKIGIAKYEIQVYDPNAPKYTLVTDASLLTNGTKIIIVAEGANGKVALGTTQGTKDRNAVAVTIVDGAIDPGNGVEIIELKANGENFSLYTATGYLNAYSTSDNGLTTKDTEAPASITIDSEGNATIKLANTRGIIKYNSSSNFFRCYSSGQAPVQIYASLAPVDPDAVAQPTITLDVNKVTIACETEGAEIHYTTDGTTATAESPVYDGQPFEVFMPTTISAIAVKDGKESRVATYNTNLFVLEDFSMLSEITEESTSYQFMFTCPMTVLYQGSAKKRMYVRSGYSNMFIYSDSEMAAYNPGDVINGAAGTFKFYNGLLQFIPKTFGEVTGTAAVPEPTVIEFAEMQQNMINEYVRLVDVTITAGSNNNFTLTNAAGETVACYNGNAITVPTDSKKYDVIGFVGIFSNASATTIQMTPTEFINYSAEASIEVDPVEYIKDGKVIGNANWLKLTTPTVAANGQNVAAEGFEIYLNDTKVGTVGEQAEGFAFENGKDNVFTIRDGEHIIPMTVTGATPDSEAEIEGAEYIVDADGVTTHVAFYVVPKNKNGLYYTVKSDDADVYWRHHATYTGAACHFYNVHETPAPATFDARISYPIAVLKSSEPAAIKLMAEGDALESPYDFVEYDAVPTALDTTADELKQTDSNTSSVADVAEDQEGEVEFFNLQGVRVNGELTPGLYIRRQGNRATKVVVK